MGRQKERREMTISPKISYTFKLASDTRAAWKMTKYNLLAPWLIKVEVYLKNPNDIDGLVHELVESYLAQLIRNMEYVEYRKVCLIAHILATLALPRLKG